MSSFSLSLVRVLAIAIVPPLVFPGTLRAADALFVSAEQRSGEKLFRIDPAVAEALSAGAVQAISFPDPTTGKSLVFEVTEPAAPNRAAPTVELASDPGVRMELPPLRVLVASFCQRINNSGH